MKARVCTECGKQFYKYSGKTCSRVCFANLMRKHSTGKTLSDVTKKRISESLPKGEKHHKWKGGRTHNEAGYILIKQKGNKYVREHRLIVEAAIGRKLKTWEHIHHIDGSKTNNKIENLMIVTNEQHRKIHNHKSKRKELGKKGTWFIVKCNKCNKIFEIAGYKFRSGRGKYCSMDCYKKVMSRRLS